MKFIPLILLALLFGACAGDPDIQTEFNPTVDFTQFRSFSVADPNVQAAEGSVGRDPRVLETIFRTIREDLSARSMEPKENGADLSVAISVAVGEESGVAGAGYAWDSSGGRAMPKERIEVFGGGRCAIIDDFKSLDLIVGGRRKRHRLPTRSF